ncbi:SusC/RagA family TonB-linked outer membrane protein [Sphingobacterium wenxiniae]|uniref:TonB-linked outer membrane protein, SusC/RagA family n=1 Tax=Sphingobacterium wenxiniae TaxID=683125 RepID=A0A1I6VQJ5_9SPHI|nr:SusC/RagA family TonB-linked outer membrane protein [Sphingobacterium wenxiniae]SFT15851.1 TonB-linked outer membrane protein, SusC/RagA family [Sphingobacterium wenxiniae]
MKSYILSAMFAMAFLIGAAQHRIEGTVRGQDSRSVIAAAVINGPDNRVLSVSGTDGTFSFIRPQGVDSVLISHLGYQAKWFNIADVNTLDVFLSVNNNELEEIEISTGYFTVPKNRSTGSFESADNRLLNQAVSTDILSRLEGVVGSLNFDRRTDGHSHSLKLRLRGLSTINSDETPLIILDNFPFNGSLESINPNDVENITVLKDAAATSIWGARAGNGVIVINTKRAKANEPTKVMANISYRVETKPDLNYNPYFIRSSSFIPMEESLFERGFYTANDPGQSPQTPIVERLFDLKENRISFSEYETLRNKMVGSDYRRDIERYLLRTGLNSQYFVSLTSGGEKLSTMVSLGFDKNKDSQIDNEYQRATLSLKNSYKLNSIIDFSTNVNYFHSRRWQGALNPNDLIPRGKMALYPYASLMEAGFPAAIPKNHRLDYAYNAQNIGLLDWEYKPLAEKGMNRTLVEMPEYRVSTALNIKPIPAFILTLMYEKQAGKSNTETLYDKNSYYVRNEINRFTQVDGSHIFPQGDILRNLTSSRNSDFFRINASYEQNILDDHEISLLAGTEWNRRNEKIIPGTVLYGFDRDVGTGQTMFDYTKRYPTLPNGTARITSPPSYYNEFDDRFLSYYFNGAYLFRKKYNITTSVRKDMSNLFGVQQNQKGVPLWSVGGAWDIAKENFFPWNSINSVRLRATYGSSGNLDKTVTALTTIYYSTSSLTENRFARIETPPNPNLRWERVNTLNLGTDLILQNNRIRLTVEWYKKNGKDLMGLRELDPTGGYLNAYRINYAELKTYGADISLHAKVVDKKFSWETSLFASWVRDRISEYSEEPRPQTMVGAISHPLINRPRYAIYSYPWQGLDNAGNPLVKVGDAVSTDYVAFNSDLQLEDLIYHGPASPTFFGNLRNRFSYGSFSLAVNLRWKSGFYYRSPSISYGDLFNSWKGHRDFDNRWQKPGDEKNTDIPSMPEGSFSYLRDVVYLASEHHVKRGDNIRIQDMFFEYNFALGKRAGRAKLGNTRIFVHATNIGIIWKANNDGLDPDIPFSLIPEQKNISFGLQTTF